MGKDDCRRSAHDGTHEVIVPLCALVLLTFSLSLLANEWRERLDPIRRLERC